MSDLRMPDINMVMEAGRLTRDPELQFIANGTALCKLGLAVSRKYKTKEGSPKEETLFVNVTVWGKSAEWVNGHIKKGYPVMVQGRLTSNEWEDKTTGQKRTAIEITADRVQQLNWDNLNGDSSSGSQGEIGEPSQEDDIPF